MNVSSTAPARTAQILATEIRVRPGISWGRAGVIALEKGAITAEVFRSGGVHMTVAITGTFQAVSACRRALGEGWGR